MTGVSGSVEASGGHARRYIGSGTFVVDGGYAGLMGITPLRLGHKLPRPLAGGAMIAADAFLGHPARVVIVFHVPIVAHAHQHRQALRLRLAAAFVLGKRQPKRIVELNHC